MAFGTLTPTSRNVRISTISYVVTVGVAATTLSIQDKQVSPMKLLNAVSTAAAGTSPTVINFDKPVLLTGGMDIVTAGGAGAATIHLWINGYY